MRPKMARVLVKSVRLERQANAICVTQRHFCVTQRRCCDPTPSVWPSPNAMSPPGGSHCHQRPFLRQRADANPSHPLPATLPSLLRPPTPSPSALLYSTPLPSSSVSSFVLPRYPPIVHPRGLVRPASRPSLPPPPPPPPGRHQGRGHRRAHPAAPVIASGCGPPRYISTKWP